MRLPTRFDITQNKDMRKRSDRKPLSFIHFVGETSVGFGIVHLKFTIDGEDVIFLDDNLGAKWLVSECNKFIVGSGVLNKIYRTVGA